MTRDLRIQQEVKVGGLLSEEDPPRAQFKAAIVGPPFEKFPKTQGKYRITIC